MNILLMFIIFLIWFNPQFTYNPTPPAKRKLNKENKLFSLRRSPSAVSLILSLSILCSSRSASSSSTFLHAWKKNPEFSFVSHKNMIIISLFHQLGKIHTKKWWLKSRKLSCNEIKAIHFQVETLVHISVSLDKLH